MRYDKDRPSVANPLKIQDVTLRDGFQSLFATRGKTEDMIPVAEIMDGVGFWAMEVWGGATFDVMHRFLNEDPWDRIRILKRYIRNTPLSMLLRGQNLVGYRIYADDVVCAFMERACANGIDIFRTFDALNDFRNFESIIPIIKKNDKHFQGCICYSLTEPRLGGEVYTLEYFIDKAKSLEECGADSICLKDMAGLLAPYDAYELVQALKETTHVPIHLHTHYTSGMAQMTQLKAIESGVDIIDTCMAPFAFRTSHPAIEPLVLTLLGSCRDTGFDINQLITIDNIIEKDILPNYAGKSDDAKMPLIDINVLMHQIPGGMLSNLAGQLKEIDALDKLNHVFEKIPQVRKDLGQAPLVTPISQIVGVQAVNNVLFGNECEPYKIVTNQVKDLCFGLYGKTPAPINPDVRKKVLKGYKKGEKPITCRPGGTLEPELDAVAERIQPLSKDLDDVLIAALYPITGRKFLKWKYCREKNCSSAKSDSLKKEAAKVDPAKNSKTQQ